MAVATHGSSKEARQRATRKKNEKLKAERHAKALEIALAEGLGEEGVEQVLRRRAGGSKGVPHLTRREGSWDALTPETRARYRRGGMGRAEYDEGIMCVPQSRDVTRQTSGDVIR